MEQIGVYLRIHRLSKHIQKQISNIARMLLQVLLRLLQLSFLC